jgi:hypothetical protein
MAQKPVLREEVNARALRASKSIKRAEVWVGWRCACWVGGAWSSAGVQRTGCLLCCCLALFSAADSRNAHPYGKNSKILELEVINMKNRAWRVCRLYDIGGKAAVFKASFFLICNVTSTEHHLQLQRLILYSNLRVRISAKTTLHRVGFYGVFVTAQP